MFGFQTKKKDYRAICEWIREKWEFSHTGSFNWSFDLGTQKVFVERSNFAIGFGENMIETSYIEKVRSVTKNEERENQLIHTFSFKLDKIERVEAIDAPNIEIGFWGKPVLQLGVMMYPFESEKAIVKTTKGKTIKRLGSGEVVVSDDTQHEVQVLDKGYLYLGNGADLHLRGKQALEDLIGMSGGLSKREELY